MNILQSHKRNHTNIRLSNTMVYRQKSPEFYSLLHWVSEAARNALAVHWAKHLPVENVSPGTISESKQESEPQLASCRPDMECEENISVCPVANFMGSTKTLERNPRHSHHSWRSMPRVPKQRKMQTSKRMRLGKIYEVIKWVSEGGCQEGDTWASEGGTWTSKRGN